jgi:hypothetical protein
MCLGVMVVSTKCRKRVWCGVFARLHRASVHRASGVPHPLTRIAESSWNVGGRLLALGPEALGVSPQRPASKHDIGTSMDSIVTSPRHRGAVNLSRAFGALVLTVGLGHATEAQAEAGMHTFRLVPRHSADDVFTQRPSGRWTQASDRRAPFSVARARR